MNNSKNEFEDKEIIQENINNENYCNDIQICNLTILDYIIKRLNYFLNAYIAYKILLAILVMVFLHKKKNSKLKFTISYFKLIGLIILSIENDILAKLLKYKKFNR